MTNTTKAQNLIWLSGGALTAVEALLDQLDVYRLALAMATGEEPAPGLDNTFLPDPESPESCSAQDYISCAQDELRHGRGPEWLTEDHDGQ